MTPTPPSDALTSAANALREQAHTVWMQAQAEYEQATRHLRSLRAAAKAARDLYRKLGGEEEGKPGRPKPGTTAEAIYEFYLEVGATNARDAAEEMGWKQSTVTSVISKYPALFRRVDGFPVKHEAIPLEEAKDDE